MTFEIYKLEWILSRHTFGNTTQNLPVRQKISLWRHVSGYPCPSKGFHYDVFSMIQYSGAGGFIFHFSTNFLQQFSICFATRRYTSAD